jgi:hypothetical protein
MNVYIAHSTNFNFMDELYRPLSESTLSEQYNFTFPHENTGKPYSSRAYFADTCDVVIAEVSYPSTGMGIEIGWADSSSVPIVCMYKKGSVISTSLTAVTKQFAEYTSEADLVEQLAKILPTLQNDTA